MSDGYTFGIEEEYFVFERERGEGRESAPSRFFEAAEKALGGHVSHELLQSQIEVATTPCLCAAEAHAQLVHFRQTLAAVAERHGLGILAAGTHPSADWSRQRHTDMPRYDKVAHDLQILARRQMICGMHVHVGIPEGVSRVGLMARALPYLPLFLALSTSSPFWQSRRTGLMSYRQAVFAACRGRGGPISSATKRTTKPSSPRWSATASSPMPASCGGTSTLPFAFRPWNSGSPTSAPKSTTRSRSPCSIAASSATFAGRETQARA